MQSRPANPNDATLKKVPYTGVQYVGIPEFQSFGTIITVLIFVVAVLAIALAGIVYRGNRGLYRSLGGSPGDAGEILAVPAAGGLSHPIHVPQGGSFSLLFRVKEMRGQLRAT